MVASLGLAENLVAVSHECDYPADVAQLPKATASIIPHGLDQASIDRLVSQAMAEATPLYKVDYDLLENLGVNLVITQGLCEVCAVTPRTIEATRLSRSAAADAAGCPANPFKIVSMDGRSFAGITDDLRRLASTADDLLASMLAQPEGRHQLQARAEAVIATAKADWQEITSAKPPPQALSVLMLEWIDPFFSGGHWVPEQIIAAGHRPALCETPQAGIMPASRRLETAEIIAADPDAIGVICCGFGLEENADFAAGLYANPALASLRAIRDEQIFAFDANSHFSRPSLRIAEGAAVLAAALKPDAQRQDETAAGRILWHQAFKHLKRS